MLEDEDSPEVLLLALRDVAEALGFSQFARRSGLNRAGLYRMLTKRGNPSFRSVQIIFDTIGLRLRVERKRSA